MIPSFRKSFERVVFGFLLIARTEILVFTILYTRPHFGFLISAYIISNEPLSIAKAHDHFRYFKMNLVSILIKFLWNNHSIQNANARCEKWHSMTIFLNLYQHYLFLVEGFYHENLSTFYEIINQLSFNRIICK